MNARRFALVSIVAAALLRLALAPLRTLSADEAYYLWAARRATPWPIVDHPPLLGALLTAADRIVPGPIELRVRLVATVLQLGTAIAIARIARHAASAESKEESASTAATLATWGLMPTAGGLLATPDAPLLCALAWTLALTMEAPSKARDAGLALLALAASASKAIALPFLALLALAHLARRSRRTAATLLAGTALGAPVAWTSLRLQLAHAVGVGPFVSAPRVGPLAALGVLIVGQLLLWSPPLLVVGVVALRRRSFVLGDRWLVTAFALAAAVSAIVSGRAPEPNWTAPAALVVIVAAAVALAGRRTLRRVVVALAALPALVAIAGWIAPVDGGPFARVPRRGHGPPADAPAYGAASWRCIYEDRCEEIETISIR